MPPACSDMIRIPCLHKTKRPSPFGAFGMRPTDTAQETSRGRDSHAFSFSLRETEKLNKGIQQCAHCFMNMPPACSDMIRIPCFHQTKRPSPFGAFGMRPTDTAQETSRGRDSHAFSFSLRETEKLNKGIQQCAHCFMNMPPACSDMIRIPCFHQTKRPSPFGAVGMRPADTAQQKNRGRDSHASDFPLRGTGKSDKGIDQFLNWSMKATCVAFGHDSNPVSPQKNPSSAQADNGFLVETEGFEPLTLRMRTVRSPS